MKFNYNIWTLKRSAEHVMFSDGWGLTDRYHSVVPRCKQESRNYPRRFCPKKTRGKFSGKKKVILWCHDSIVLIGAKNWWQYGRAKSGPEENTWNKMKMKITTASEQDMSAHSLGILINNASYFLITKKESERVQIFWRGIWESLGIVRRVWECVDPCLFFISNSLTPLHY